MELSSIIISEKLDIHELAVQKHDEN